MELRDFLVTGFIEIGKPGRAGGHFFDHRDIDEHWWICRNHALYLFRFQTQSPENQGSGA
jgi:hypothetical protein